MMTQNLMTQAVDSFSNSKVSKPDTEKKSGINSDFSSVMDNSMKSKQNTVKQSTVKQSTKSTIEKSDIKGKKVNNNQSSDDNAEIVNDVSTKTKNVDVKETAKSQPTTNSDVAESDETKCVQEKIEKMIGMLQNTVQSNLGLSTEELNKAMETLGLTMLDLLNVDNLKQLVLQVNGFEDITAVLTDEKLATSIQNLIQAVNGLQLGETAQISQEEIAAYTNSDVFKEAIKALEATKVTEATEPIASKDSNDSIQNEMLEKNPIIPNENLSSIKALDEDSSKTVTNQKEIILEVQKTTENNTTDANTSDNNEAEVEQPTQVDSFVNNLAVFGKENNLSFTEQISNIRQMQEITNQIVEQIKVIIKPDQSSMELQLNPENLGKINLSVIAKDGIMTAQFTTQNEIAKEAIESQMQVLRDNLSNQGLKVDAIEVTVSNFTFEQSNQASTGEEQQNNSQRRNIFRDEDEIFNNLTEEETLAVNIMEQNGNRVDYTA